MGLDVFVLRPPFGSLPAGTDGRVCRLDHDGYYCYLSRFLPQSSSSGRRIQDAMHVGDAHFEGTSLDQLEGCLEKAAASLGTQPTSWQEHTGMVQRKSDPAPRDTYDVVHRETLRAKIKSLLAAVRQAKECNGRLFFYGE